MYLDSSQKNVQAKKFVTVGKTLGNEDYVTNAVPERYDCNMSLHRIVAYIDIV